MIEKLNEKSKTLKEKDQLIAELINVLEKYKAQLNCSDDMLKLTANKLYIEAANLKHHSSSNSNGNGNKASGLNYSNSVLRTKK